MQEKRVRVPIKEIMLEVQSHTGLPTNFGLAGFYTEVFDCYLPENLVSYLKDSLVNELMIYYHKYRKSRFPNIKSYDW